MPPALLLAPLALNYADDAGVRVLQETSDAVRVLVVNELLIRGNLPAATRQVLQNLHA